MSAESVSKEDEVVALFRSIGVKESMARDLSRNKKKAKILQDVIEEVWFAFSSSADGGRLAQAGVSGGCDESLGNLLMTVATSLSESSWQHRRALVSYLGGIDSIDLLPSLID